ncbi:uncharacterized protein BP5553_09709 [Venustampulla echinocandica]|uniref:AIG1-type G domain-containing protein n=1 Tax=Venustampulla echinocandica TaxID=2656787 RepID=A0A370TBS4_9HELO|nr:uncharacterized protein BP5553_09709 [Venustampulla echinocandica]RDL31500.1 hypothetical protein BP5553_09709 [Venustampulla echinocandica]
MVQYTHQTWPDGSGGHIVNVAPREHGIGGAQSTYPPQLPAHTAQRARSMPSTPSEILESSTAGSSWVSDVPRNSPQEEGWTTRPKISILVMGGTGVGKSALIAKLTGSPVKLGHTLQSCTTQCKGWNYIHESNTTVTLIDTPGFDDTVRPDMEILASIASYIRDPRHAPPVGVIYMHRITDKKMTGASRMNLEMLRAVCGEHYFQNVVLVTSMWDTIPAARPLSEFEAREAELMASTEFLGDLVDKGANPRRYLGDGPSATQIVDVLCNKHQAPPLKITLELSRSMQIEDTTAGRILTAELRKREKKRLHEIEEEREEERMLRAELAETEAKVRDNERRLRAEIERERRARKRQEDAEELQEHRGRNFAIKAAMIAAGWTGHFGDRR